MPMIIDGTNGGFFPSWTTATRPASPAVGQMGYNTTTGAFDAYTVAGWVSVASSATAPVNGPAFSAYKSANQTVVTNTLTKVTFDTEVFDTNSNFTSSTFTPTVAGYYQINANIDMAPLAGTLSQATAALYKNGSSYLNTYNYSTITEFTGVISGLVYMNGSTDTLEIYARLTGTTPFVGSGSSVTTFAGVLVRSA